MRHRRPKACQAALYSKQSWCVSLYSERQQHVCLLFKPVGRVVPADDVGVWAGALTEPIR